MTTVLGWWPIGERNADEPPMATAIRNGSADAPSEDAIPMPTGAMRMTAAALSMKSDKSIVTSRTIASIAQGGSAPSTPAMAVAIRSAPPKVSSDCPTGIIAPRRIITGQFIDRYAICRARNAPHHEHGHRGEDRDLYRQDIEGSKHDGADEYPQRNHGLARLADPEVALGSGK